VTDGLPYTESERARLRRALPPFDGVTLALTLDRHYDHFDAEYALDFLFHSPDTVFATGRDAVDDMRPLPGFDQVEDRIVEIAFHEGDRTDLDIQGVRVTALHLRHVVSEGPNLAFLLEPDGIRVLHLGDASPSDYAASHLLHMRGGAPLDVLLAASYRRLDSPLGLARVRDALAPRFAVPMHLLRGRGDPGD